MMGIVALRDNNYPSLSIFISIIIYFCIVLQMIALWLVLFSSFYRACSWFYTLAICMKLRIIWRFGRKCIVTTKAPDFLRSKLHFPDFGILSRYSVARPVIGLLWNSSTANIISRSVLVYVKCILLRVNYFHFQLGCGRLTRHCDVNSELSS